MQTTRIKISWKAFSDFSSTSIEFSIKTNAHPLQICEMVFMDTNSYSGKLWKIIEPLLPSNRTHTAISVGDEVKVNGTSYRCEPIGWNEIRFDPFADDKIFDPESGEKEIEKL